MSAIIPGAASGATMECSVRHRDAPSMDAASSSASGMVSKIPFSIQTHSGMVNVVKESTRAVYVLSMPKLEKTVYSVTSRSACGNIWEASTRCISDRRPV